MKDELKVSAGNVFTDMGNRLRKQPNLWERHA